MSNSLNNYTSIKQAEIENDDESKYQSIYQRRVKETTLN